MKFTLGLASLLLLAACDPAYFPAPENPSPTGRGGSSVQHLKQYGPDGYKSGKQVEAEMRAAGRTVDGGDG